MVTESLPLRNTLLQARGTGLVHNYAFDYAYDPFVLLQPYMVGGYDAGVADVVVVIVRY